MRRREKVKSTKINQPSLIIFRAFIKNGGKFVAYATALGLLIVPTMSGCNHKDPIIPHGGSANVSFVDMNGTPLVSGQILYDGNTKSATIVNGQASLKWDNSDDMQIMIPGYVQRGSFAENKEYMMMPNNWNAFFADGNIAGRDGTNKFAGQIKARIDGPTDDPDYNRAKNIFEKDMNKLGASYTLVDSGENYKIILNANENTHGETTNNGIISYAEVKLKDNFDETSADHEFVCATMHVDEPAQSGPEETAIADTSLVTSADIKIYKAFYNRKNSKVTIGSEQENR